MCLQPLGSIDAIVFDFWLGRKRVWDGVVGVRVIVLMVLWMMCCVPMVIGWFIGVSACSVCYVVGRREWKGVCADFGIGGWRVRCGDVEKIVIFPWMMGEEMVVVLSKWSL